MKRVQPGSLPCYLLSLGELRPIKLVLPLFSGRGQGEELGNWSAWSWTWALPGGSKLGAACIP